MENAEANLSKIFKAKLSTREFDKLSHFIYNEYGIKMPKVKITMLQSRLQKRLRALDMTSFKEYVEYVFSKKGQMEEVMHMIDVVSTNKTDFFREPVHFEFLSDNIMPALMIPSTRYLKLKVWSAGCSSGEEPYTIAITLSELKRKYPNLDFEILGTDISSRILQQAANAIYKEERIQIIPNSLKKKYFLKSKDQTAKLVRVVPALRKKVRYQRLNFIENSYNIHDKYDIIFCRNVLIYFDRETQERVINRLCHHLKPEGYFLLGHSESITNIDVPLIQIKPTIFKRK